MGQVEKNVAQFTRQAEAYAALAVGKFDNTLPALIAFSEASPGMTVLDVACGPGLVSVAFAAHGCFVTGIDVTAHCLDMARARAAEQAMTDRTTFIEAAAAAIPLPSDSFDLAVCRFAFHHMEAPAAALGEMARAVRPGGRVLVADMTCDDDPAKAELHNRIERLCDPSHARAGTLGEMIGMFEAAGLKIDKRAALDDSSYTLTEWLAHGAPPAEAEAEIRRLMESSIDQDRTGLRVRRAADDLVFSHSGAVILATKPA
jgi:ubiquinone/menaquinone biosynthesis C-methylase UbiE